MSRMDEFMSGSCDSSEMAGVNRSNRFGGYMQIRGSTTRLCVKWNSMIETIKWNDVDVELPDDSVTVLVHIPEADGEQVWPGYLDDDQWMGSDGMPLSVEVTHWAQMPIGPLGSNALGFPD